MPARLTEEWLSAYNARRKGGAKSKPSDLEHEPRASGGLNAAQGTLLQRTKGIRIDTGKRPKYGNRKTIVDNIVWDSVKEASRYAELRLLERAGEISDLMFKVTFPLDIEGHHICNYICDFAYITKAGDVVVEDTKGVRTREFRIKAKLMMVIYRIKILET